MRTETLLRIAVASCIGVLAVSATATATTITFDEFEAQGVGVVTLPSPYVAPQNGFVFTELSPFHEFAYYLQQDTSYAGSAGLADNGQGGTVEISDGGTAFTLNSIDLSFLLNESGSVPVTFTGNYVGGGSTMQTFTVTQFGFQTFTFNSTFTNLANVEFGPQFPPPFYQFDNVMVNGSSRPVPEPASMLLFGSGVGAAIVKLRRRKA
jgi:hypothetical protein